MGDGRLARRGVVAGLLGAGTVAVWFLVIDTAQGRPLFTPGALGSVVFLGADEIAAVEVSAFTVGGYTAVHVIVFVLIGMAASALIARARERPYVILGGLLLVGVLSAFFLALLAILAEFLLGPLTWWSVALGTLFALVVMGVYLWRRDPDLEGAVEEDPFREEPG